MKQPIILLSILCFTFGICSCQKAPELILTGPSSIDMSSDGGSTSFSFTANRDWTISSSDTWITVSPSKGTASDGAVTVTVKGSANTTYDDRSATVTITMEELRQSVTVRQAANQGIVILTQSFNLTPESGTIEVEVSSNVQYSVEISATWIKHIDTKGLTTDKLSFAVEENSTYESREGAITIKPQNSSLSNILVSIKQTGRIAVTSITMSPESLSIPNGESSQLTARVEPEDSYEKTISWKSSDENIVTVDETGLLFAKGLGVATVVASCGGKSATCTVKVIDIPTNEIWYTSSDNSIVKPYYSEVFYTDDVLLTIQSNTYATNYGVIEFDGPVVRIGSRAFENCETLTSIIIPNSVRLIDFAVFYNCGNLTKVVLHDGITLGVSAFDICTHLKDITLPSAIKEIPAYCFEWCFALTEIDIPEEVESIGTKAFTRSGLTSITIPQKVEVIGESAFENCENLEVITVLATTPPSGNERMFANTGSCPIKVPVTSINAYKSAPYWRDYADRIQGISG